MRALLVCVVAAVATLAATAESAHACTCVAPDPRVLLAQSDGAFVGRVVSSRRLGPGRRLLTFRVERRFKGAIGARVDVESPADSAGCGVSAPAGRRVALFLDRHRGRWRSTLCRQVDPAALVGRKRAPAGHGSCPSG